MTFTKFHAGNLYLLIFILPLFFTSLQVTAQTGKSISSLVPGGYVVMDSIAGDYNMDKIGDAILVLKNAREDSGVWSLPRPMLLVTGVKDGGYLLAARCDKLVFAHNMGGASESEPYRKTVNNNDGSFTIVHSGGMGSFSWQRHATFKYDRAKKNWNLSLLKDNTFTVDESAKDFSGTGNEHKLTPRDFGILPFRKFDYSKFELL